MAEVCLNDDSGGTIQFDSETVTMQARDCKEMLRAFLRESRERLTPEIVSQGVVYEPTRSIG
jgi:hypothetical protein